VYAAHATDDLQLLESVFDERQQIDPNDLARCYGQI
jgi:hypothetical protein